MRDAEDCWTLDGRAALLKKAALMAYLVGIVLGLIVCIFAMRARFDLDRSFYPTVLIVVASYYGLFAVMGNSLPALMTELLGIAVFVAIALVGFAYSRWWIVGGLAGHGLFDLTHGYFVADPGVPGWWPAFCLAFDLIAAIYLAGILLKRRISDESIR